MEYSYEQKPGVRIAKARLAGINASFKDLCEVCRNVRGKDTQYALEFLKRASEGKQAILFLRHCKKKGHRKELGGKKGGFPVKSAKAVLEVLKSAHANAERLGLSQTKIAHIVANKHATYPRLAPKGRRIRQDYELSFVELVLEEIQQDGNGKKGKEKGAKNKSVNK